MSRTGNKKITAVKVGKKAKASRMGSSGKRGDAMLTVAARKMFALFCAMAIAMCAMGAIFAGSMNVASAAEFDGQGSYADELIGDTGWKSDLITDLKDENGESVVSDPGDMGQGLVGDISQFFVSLGVIIIVLTIVLCVFRLAGRAVWMMVAGGNGNISMGNQNKQGDISYSDMWVFFMTAEERDSRTMKNEWFVQMMKETMVFLFIGIAAGGIVMVLAGVASAIVGNVAGISNNAGVGDFNVSGIHVATDGNNWKGTNN